MSYEMTENMFLLAVYAGVALCTMLIGGLISSGLETWRRNKKLRQEYRLFKKTWSAK